MVRPPRFVVEIRIGPDAQGVKNGRCQIGRRERLSGRNATVSVGSANNPSRLDATTGQETRKHVAPVMASGVNFSPDAFLPLAEIGEIFGVRPISPHITTKVSSSNPRSSRSSRKPLRQ